MSNPYPSPNSRPLEQLKVAELRDELRRRGLSLKGVKKDLFERLDEAVRKEHAGTLPCVPEVIDEQHKDGDGDYDLEGEHGITHSTGHPHYYSTSENVQGGDGLLYLNNSENPLQDSALIVNNASPYVGASDATPVIMELRKEVEKPNKEFVASEESQDDVPVSSGPLSESINAGAVEAPRPENLVLQSDAGVLEDEIQVVEDVASFSEPDKQSSGVDAILPGKEASDIDLPDAGEAPRSENFMLESNVTVFGVENQVDENVASLLEPDKRASGNEAILLGKEASDIDLPADSQLTGGNDVVVPEYVSKSCGDDGLLAALELNSMSTVSMDDTLLIHNCVPSSIDAIAGKSVTVLQKPELSEVTHQGEMAIPSGAVKDVANASVLENFSSVADASLLAPSHAMIANATTVQDAEVIEKTTSAVLSVREVQEEGSCKVESAEGTCLEVERAEDTKRPEVLETGEASIPTSADREAPEMPLVEAIKEAVQDARLPEVQDTSISDLLQDSVMHGVVQNVVVQEMPHDTEMSEALESPSMKMEVSEMTIYTEPAAVSMDALKHSMGTKFENVGSLSAANFNRPNEAVRDMVVDEGKPNVKLEPMEAESKGGRRKVPVEDVKMEQQEVKGDLPKSGRSFDRLRPKESEYERSRHELGRTSAYGNESNRAERKLGRVFKEERRKDLKEKELKPVEEEFSDRSSQKRKDDDRDTKEQEHAKRMRRWNSGNELVVETAKPLSTDIVKEIMTPEIKKERFAVAPPKLTPKLSGPSRPTPATAKTNAEVNSDKRAVPPSTRAPTSSLKIERFVRPFTLKAVKDLLSEFGQCEDFWMDQIKTHCYVMYSKVNEAVAARNGLYNKQWPPSFGNLLVADFVDSSEVKMRSDGSFERMNAPPATTPQGVANQPPAHGTQPSGSFHGHSNALAFAPALRERQLMQVPLKEPEPPVPTLDDLFRKTQAKPQIYYLPLTDEQVTEKLASVKNKRQLQARSKLLGRA